MKRCRFSALAAGLILSGSLCLSGCSIGLKDAYSLKERVPSIEASFAAEDEAAKGFASDLCVISDEGSFDPEDVTSQAGALLTLQTVRSFTVRMLLKKCTRPALRK